MNTSVASNKATLSIILPAKNEAPSLQRLLPKLRERFPKAQVIVVDDGSTDDTQTVCSQYELMLITHRYSIGNGAAVKHGARAASGQVLAFMDADGQHDPQDIDRLLKELHSGYDMVIGAREPGSQANFGRSLANRLYNGLASYMTGHRIGDLTSGFRVARAKKFREFLNLLPNGFSYPTTSTMAFFRAGYQVSYVPITAAKRQGTSHIHPVKDGIRFLLIIFKVATLYAPLKIFFPISGAFFTLGIGYYLYTYFTEGRFTNMSALLLTTAIVVFLIGLVSEQVTALMYRKES